MLPGAPIRKTGNRSPIRVETIKDTRLPVLRGPQSGITQSNTNNTMSQFTSATTEETLFSIVERSAKDKSILTTVIMYTPWSYIRMEGRLRSLVSTFVLDPSGNNNPFCTDEIKFQSNGVETIGEDGIIYLRSEN
jgi:hypothetical protein